MTVIGYTTCGCPVNKRYTICLEKNKDIGLLFESLDLDEVRGIQELDKFFPSGHSARYVGTSSPERWVNGAWGHVDVTRDKAKHILVSEVPLDFEPDKAALDRPPTVFNFQGKQYVVNLRERYNECLSLLKAFGCDKCPDRGLKCLAEGAKFEPVRSRINNFSEEEIFLDELEQRHKKLGPFEFVSPSATRVKNEFAAKFRVYWEHSFDAITANAEELSVRAERAADSRRFKKEQCSKCVISSSCESFRHCKGAYPPVEGIITQCNEELIVALKGSAWPEWQLWEIARNMGNSAKHSRWNIFLAGLKLQGSQGIVHSVKRAKLDIEEYKGLKTYAEIAEAFSLAKTPEDAVGEHHGPPTDPGLRAAFWLALNTPNAYQRYGWGSSEHVAGLGITNKSVTVRWTSGKYLRGWADINNVADVARHLSYGRLAHMQKIEVRYKET